MKIVFMGTPDFAVPSLSMLIENGYHVAGVVTQPDRPKGRKRQLAPPPVKQAALRYHLPVLQSETLKDRDVLNQLKEWAPDLIVTAAFGQLLPPEVLQLPPLGCINVHASLLPKYRGGAPIHRAIMNGEKETGVTIMYMVEKLDAGDILTQVRVPIDDHDDVGTLHDKLSQAGAELLIQTLPRLERGEISPIPQDDALATYAPVIKREDERIDWSKPHHAVYNHIRGLRPFPVAFTTVNGQPLKVWKAIKTDQEQQNFASGTIYRLDETGIGVVCGDGVGLILTEIQPSGKKRMSAADFLRGAGAEWHIGQRLGT
ncbi:Methionyl-tRNA formyltransferase [Caldalkalibacillus thermarum TA2.A1]|uniref:Methionyl-tRNA formyltransferase n=1 Tax=Caldalkalibacillus thermarum (strain TA2.A1) TaxID=986075 RepID=F5L7U7_CALTT|nr:methionyl-tRNA formyltransferase [Caldalkalibacillus thermarum]EGL82606.1 Methionyl-tRNA formyltransferase [Caldalkalibacillus thermarum TA2.A1]